MPRRSTISPEVKLASALLALGQIPYEHAQLMTAAQINSLFAFDHDPIPHAAGGPDEPWNLTPRMIVPHRVKTATIDVPAIAKAKRLAEEHEASRRRILARKEGRPRPPDRWPKRNMQSRNNLKRAKP